MTSAAEIVHDMAIGSSEIAMVLDVSPWGGPVKVFCRHHNLSPPEPEDERKRAGKKFQRVVAEMFTEHTGLEHEWNDRPDYPPDKPYMRVSVDAFIPTIRAPKAVVEIKWVALDQAGDWPKTYGRIGNENGIPLHYLLQVLWQLAAYGLDVGYIVVMIAGNDLRIYRIERDLPIEAWLLQEAEKFWREHLMAGVEPPPGRGDDIKAYLHRRYPRVRENIRPATDAEIALLDEYAAVRAQWKPLNKRKDELEDKLRLAVGPAEGLEWERGKFTNKNIKDHQEVNWEKLAKPLIDSYPEDIRQTMIAEHTETTPQRRIYFKEVA